MLANAAPVSAGCAWVLWREIGINDPATSTLPDWKIDGASETLGECEAAKKKMIAVLTEIFEKQGQTVFAPTDVATIFISTKSGPAKYQALHCYPAGLDPRPR